MSNDYTGAIPTYSIIVCTLDNTDGLVDFIKTLLVQQYLPEDMIVVHGRSNGNTRDRVGEALDGSGIRLVYASCPPGLVHQRNLGLDLCRSELALFFDDDVLLEKDYIRNLLEVYTDDTEHLVGGVTGLITNMPYSPKLARVLKRFFMLYTGYGTGRMRASGMPSFLSPEATHNDTQFFAGCLMSFRMDTIRNIRFDENLHPYWWGDDFEFCYRVSLVSRLVQTTGSKLAHKGSSVNKKSFRRFWRMQVVNHLYIFKKHRSWFEFPCFVWSLLGNLMFASLQSLKGYRFDGLLGYFEGVAEIIGLRKANPADKWNRNLAKVVYSNTSRNNEHLLTEQGARSAR